MLHMPLTVLRCVAKNMLARIGLGPFLKDALGVSQTEVNWATRPVDEIYRHVTEIFQELTTHAGLGTAQLDGKVALEIGPGTNLGVALMFLVHGCRRAIVVEQSDTVRKSKRSAALYRRIVEEHGGDANDLLGPAWGLSATRIWYYPHAAFESADQIEGTSVDLVYSYQVLEHIADLEGCFRNLFRILRPGGATMHMVDLSGHSEFARSGSPLDFLRYPDHVWQLMFSHRPNVNRLRLGAYLRCIEASGLELVTLAKLRALGAEEVEAIRPRLSPPFSRLPIDELCVTRFFFLARKPHK